MLRVGTGTGTGTVQCALKIARADRQTLAKQPAEAWRLIESRNSASSVDELLEVLHQAVEAPVHTGDVMPNCPSPWWRVGMASGIRPAGLTQVATGMKDASVFLQPPASHRWVDRSDV